MESLARAGLGVEALSGTALELQRSDDPVAWLAGRGLEFEAIGGRTWTVDARGLRAEVPTHYRLVLRGVPITLHRSPASGPHEVGAVEQEEFLRLYDEVVGRFRPDVVVNYGGDSLAHEVRSCAQRQGIAVAFPLHNFNYHDSCLFENADAVIVPSRFAADHYRKSLGLDCKVLPYLISFDRVIAPKREPRFLTFVNPSYEKGVYAFARIADELGRRRPDIPLLVVEGRGTEQTLADCGLDLRAHGNVHMMGHTPDPRRFWGVTKVCLLPSLWWENQPLVAVEAMINGIPVIGSDRGGIPETLGDSGVILPLPERLTPFTRELPSPEEVVHWVEAAIYLWDNRGLYAEYERKALAESRRWEPEMLEPQYVRFFNELRPGGKPVVSATPKVDNAAVVVAYADDLSWKCGQALQRLEEAGVRVTRRGGCRDPDAARNALVSDALHDGTDAVLIVDADTGFDHRDAIRLLARPEPVIAGLFQKGCDHGDGFAFAPGVSGVRLVAGAHGIYPLEHAGTEFLRIRSSALRRMIDTLDLPLCDTGHGRGVWPFFQPAIIPSGEGVPRYLGAVEAFYHRLRQAGITPLADTSVRLTPVGRASPWACPATAWDQIPGMFDFAAVYDAAVDAAADGAVFVEVGCLAGRSTCYLGTRIRESGKAITLYAVDTGRGSASDITGQTIAPAVGGSLAGVLHRNLIGCGVDELVIPVVTTSARAARLFQPVTVDFCFIDADHSYESVLADLRTWWPKVKPGGTLAGHDYRQSDPWLVGVTPAVHEFFGLLDAGHPLCRSCWTVKKPTEDLSSRSRTSNPGFKKPGGLPA